jgi:hypothetical protein
MKRMTVMFDFEVSAPDDRYSIAVNIRVDPLLKRSMVIVMPVQYDISPSQECEA